MMNLDSRLGCKDPNFKISIVVPDLEERIEVIMHVRGARVVEGQQPSQQLDLEPHHPQPHGKKNCLTF